MDMINEAIDLAMRSYLKVFPGSQGTHHSPDLSDDLIPYHSDVASLDIPLGRVKPHFWADTFWLDFDLQKEKIKVYKFSVK